MTAEAQARPARGGNLLQLGLAQVFRLGSGLAINVMLMRALGVEGFGVYGTVMTLVGLAGFGASLNMNRLINRELARDPSAAPAMVGTGLVTTLGLSTLTTLGVLAWAWLADGRPVVIGAAGLAAVAMALQALATVPEAAFHATRNMGPSVRGQVAGRIALVAFTALFLWRDLGVAAVFGAQVLDGVATLGIMLWMYRRHMGALALRPRPGRVADLVREAFPFGLNGLFGSIYLSVDVLLLAMMKGDTEVGVYRGAVMLIALFPVIANTLTTGIYPRMARHLGDPGTAGAELGFASRVLLAISLPAAVGGMLTAHGLMVFLGGEAYGVSALPFVVMAPLLPLRFLNNGFSMTLSTLNRQRDRTRGVFMAALVNLGANLVVIPRYGAVGAAATTLGTEILLLAWTRWRIQPLVSGLGLPATFLRVGAPAAVMAGALLALPPLHVLVRITVGVVVYGGVGLLTGAWHPRDLKRLRRV